MLLSNLRLRYWEEFAVGELTDRIDLRTDSDLPILKRWKTAATFIERLKAEGAPFIGDNPEVGPIWIERLNGDTATPWTKYENPDWLRIEVALTATPLAWLYCGGDGAVIPVGQVCYVNHQAPTSAVNFGNRARIHLIAHVRRPPTS